jgi:hypothetical protein
MGPRLTRLFSIVGVLAILGLVAALAAGPERRRGACIAIGLCEKEDFLGAMLVAVRRQQRLLVLSARLVEPVTSARETTVGPVTVAVTRQTAILPATVHYAMDLTRMTAADLLWDAETRTLSIRRPAVEPMEPTIDWAQALTYEDGGLATVLTDVSANLKRDNEAKAPARFAAQARSAELMALANDAADAALERTFALPLAAAGMPDAKVVVTRS